MNDGQVVERRGDAKKLHWKWKVHIQGGSMRRCKGGIGCEYVDRRNKYPIAWVKVGRYFIYR